MSNFDHSRIADGLLWLIELERISMFRHRPQTGEGDCIYGLTQRRSASTYPNVCQNTFPAAVCYGARTPIEFGENADVGTVRQAILCEGIRARFPKCICEVAPA